MSDTTFVRVKKEKNYSVIDNTFLKDKTLSAGAKGVFAYILSLPEDWVIYQSELVNNFSNGKDSIRTIIKELEEHGYIVREKSESVGGKFSGYNFKIIEAPCRENRGGKTAAENPPLLNTNKQNTDIQNSSPKASKPKTSKSTSKTEGKKTLIDKEQLEFSLLGFEQKERDIASQCIKDFYDSKRSRDSKFGRSELQLLNYQYELLEYSKKSGRGIDEVARVWNWTFRDSFWSSIIGNVSSFVKNYESLIQKANANKISFNKPNFEKRVTGDVNCNNQDYGKEIF